MFSKQDVVKPRTAEDLERRYNFGKTFAETSGLIAESTKTIEESNKAIAQIKRSVSDQEAAITSLTSWKGDTSDSVARIEQRVSEQGAEITSLTEWKGETNQSIASIGQRVTDSEATIKLLTELNMGDQSSLAELVTKVSANEASIESLTEWKGGVENDVESIASIKQKADANESNITTLTEWKGGVEDDVKSIATIKQTANQAMAGVETLTEWQGGVDTDVKSIATIRQAVSDQGAAIELKASKEEVQNQLGGYYTKEETVSVLDVRDNSIKSTVQSTYATKNELTGATKNIRSTLSDIKQTADESHAGIELLVEYDENGEPTASGSLVIEAINGESSAKINADRLDIEGKELNVKVKSTNILGTLSANKIYSGTLRSNDNGNTIRVWSGGAWTEWMTGVARESEGLILSGTVLNSLGTFDGDMLVIPEGVTEIANVCTDNSTLVLPESMAEIESDTVLLGIGIVDDDILTIQTCVGNFSTLVLPESLTKIESGTFANCGSLHHIVVKGATIIESGAFDGCTELESLLIANSVDSYAYILQVFDDTIKDQCAVYYYSETTPNDDGYYYWQYKPIGLSIDLNKGVIQSPVMKLDDDLQLKGKNHTMTIEDDGILLEHIETATPETIKVSHDSIVSERDYKQRFSASPKGFTTGLPYYNDYSNMPISFHGVQNTNGVDLIGMRIGTVADVSGNLIPKLEIVVGGKVYMTFSNNKITVSDGITVEGI